MRRVLIAADSPESTTPAAAYAMQIREREPQTEFTLVNVAAPITGAGSVCPGLLDIPLSFGLDSRMKAEAVSYARQALDDAAAKLDALGLPASSVLLVGEPGAEIVRYADREAVDEIIVGARKPGLIRTILGDDPAREIAAQAGCTVTVIRPD